MATTLPAESTEHARNSAQKAMALDYVQRIGGLSRIVDRDIEILKMSVQLSTAGVRPGQAHGNVLKARGRRFAPSWPTTALQAR